MAAPNSPMNEQFGRFVETGSVEPPPAANATPAVDPVVPSEADRLRAEVAARDATIANLARPAPVAAAPAAAVAIPDMPAMPDATTHPAENEQWHRENTVRSERRMEQHVGNVAKSAIGEARALSIVQEAIARHPRYVNMQGQVRTALSGAMGDLGMASLPDDATDLISRAVKNLEATAGQFSEAQLIADAGHVVVPEAEKAPADRSGGMPAGSTSSAGTKKGEDEKAPKTMIEQIKESQAASEFF